MHKLTLTKTKQNKKMTSGYQDVRLKYWASKSHIARLLISFVCGRGKGPGEHNILHSGKLWQFGQFTINSPKFINQLLTASKKARGWAYM